MVIFGIKMDNLVKENHGLRGKSVLYFIRTIDGSEKPLNTPDEALSLMQIIDACYKSAKTGAPVLNITSQNYTI